jgi:hypothetical protein
LHEEFLPGPDGGGVDEALKTIMAAWLWCNCGLM